MPHQRHSVRGVHVGKLDGKVAVVTGASRGIGAATAELFASEGAHVVCAARTEAEGDHKLAGSLALTVRNIQGAGGEATAIRCDLSEPNDRVQLMNAAVERYGPVDVLVNNALLVYRYPVADYPLHRWMRSWEVNFQAPFHLTQVALNAMIPRRSGSIVNISSGAAIGPGRGPYPASEDA
jgi:citronellol/citronellal dehydrogenase